MSEMVGTPGSNADTSINGGKGSAPKDKACPFCGQQFTSSSLGRHLDLYIKEKNPKPADGVHNVDEIKKLRGGITRRVPRTSTSKREDSTPAGTPGLQERRSPHPEERQEHRSPSLRRDSASVDNVFKHKAGFYLNKGSWESTGVMNNIPPPRSSDSRSWNGDGEERDTGRRLEPRSRSVSKQTLAKTTFEQKQKMIDALDNAKAAELALREIVGSIRAAKQRIDGPSIFDYDPLTMDFPSLTLHCLAPPPTLFQSTPLATASSWSILPPDKTQYQALLEHFSSAFHNYRVSVHIATTAPTDELTYPPPPSIFGLEDPAEITQRAEEAASDLETRISAHLNQAFSHWSSLSQPKRSEIWTLELARSIGRKASEISTLKKERDFHKQETAHLKQQVDDLSRLQHPREFKLLAPTTVAFDAPLMSLMADRGLKVTSTGFTMLDRNMPIDAVIERAIGRWKGVVKEARGGGSAASTGGGLAAQRSLSGGSSTNSPGIPNNTSQSHTPNHAQPSLPTPTIAMDVSSISSPHDDSNHNPNMDMTNSSHQHSNNDIGSDADADADADMEDDDSYVEMSDVSQQRAPDAHMNGGPGFRLSNGSGGGGGGGNVHMEGMEGQVVGGYVRIGA